MFDNEYKAAMDDVAFSTDFEARTIEKLERELNYAQGSAADAGPSGRPRKRSRLPWLIGGGTAAAALVAVVIAGQLNAFAPSDALMPEANTVQQVVPQPAAPLATAATQSKAVDVGVYEEADAEVLYDAYEDGVTSYAAAGYLPDAAPSAALAHQPMNTNEYSFISENRFISASVEPLSTFAADIDTASYANVRSQLLAGYDVSPDAVRTEEFINYFSYDYPAPKDGEPFSVTTEIAFCPWNEDNKLLLVGLQADKVDVSKLAPSNLVFLIDVSGSMEGEDRLGLAQKAFTMLTEQLRPEDRVSIVTYAGSDRVVLDGASGDDKASILTAIDSLFAYGSTDGASGIETAYQLAQKHFIEGGNNRVVLATDGDLNVGVTNEGDLTRLIEEKKRGGVFLSVMGFGYGNYKDNKLEALADHGNGNYSYIDSLLEARKVLVEELGATFFTVAKDVKLQVEFNPAKVSKYRLIGYENRKMASQDFADDAKDGGEIGAGHSVTALYELVLANDDAADESQLKYQVTALTDSAEYLTVSIRAKAPDGNASVLNTYPVDDEHVRDALSNNMKFAAAVAEVCMNLRDSEYKGAATYQSAAELLGEVDGIENDPYKDEFAYIVRQLARGTGK